MPSTENMLIRVLHVSVYQVRLDVLRQRIRWIYDPRNLAYFDVTRPHFILNPELVDFYMPHLPQSFPRGYGLGCGCIRVYADARVYPQIPQYAPQPYARGPTLHYPVELRLSR